MHEDRCTIDVPLCFKMAKKISTKKHCRDIEQVREHSLAEKRKIKPFIT